MALKFLVVDDSVTMRRIVLNSLKQIGHEAFVEAGDGREALTKLQADDSINFIITDWNMPDLTGLDLVKAVRANPKYETLPILMVTTRGMKEDIVEALQAKVNNYIVKPFTPQVLREKIEQIIATPVA
ncbi:MAG: response regulator [Ignavibacteriales bacterium]|nr:MAG: Chemotaxis CheY-like receiver protein [Stygiobacter sp.]KAF0216456.1 MAG: Chemotaxis CheY-like receiver [Ignavibacteria bacterium]MBI3124892.1 response regulator [Ignavibacteriales bacterium]OGU68146.1 MAG: two-component system response regulator [Stygiobacter sp. GWC2_38_9]OGU78984.1 MAG: two-component system response regulator [Stygiobacter sp. RIFOXYA12_FULL_38_9]OGV07981.1 MAG: two-component system response regulator [Stygiobacter sp. RIFOXYB2_FULL_37_11]OGV11133.1 MAG: two-compon